jgi:hypothetical protein
MVTDDSAAKYIGKHLLIGVTYLDHAENILEQKQWYGTIIRVNDQEGIVIQRSDIEQEMKLPPGLRSLKEAPKGEYRMRSTGKIVVDPDFLTTWTVKRPPHEGEDVVLDGPESPKADN